MGLNFPAAPLVGDVYPVPALPGVPQWTWNGVSWKCGTIDTANYILKSGGTMTGPLILAADPVDAMGAVTKQYAESLLGQQDNFLVNGFMDVSQENGATAMAPNSYPADQWLMQGTAGFSTQQQNGGPLYGGGIDKQIAITSPASYSHVATNTAYFVQYIEGLRFARAGWGTAQGRPLSLGFWVYSNAGGVMSVCMRNAASTRSYVIPITVPAATWAYRTALFPPCLDGAWPTDNTSSANLFFSFLPTSSLIASAANTWISGVNVIIAPTATNMFTPGATTGNYLTGITLVMGNVPVPQARVPYMRKPYLEELLACCRYWQWNRYGEVGHGHSAAASIFHHSPVVPYRVTPTLSIAAGASVYVETMPWNVGCNITNPTVNGGHANWSGVEYQLGGTYSAAATNNQMMGIYDQKIKMSARL